MDRALALAQHGLGRVEPNPMVGCVIVKGGRIIGEGYHRRFGGPHAEVYALRVAGAAARGATAYVTLEPCGHFGKTPPCTDALIAAGIDRVTAAMRDPGPKVAGRGLRILRRAGVDVSVGCRRKEAEELNRPYLTLLRRKRPYIILKWAQSLDGQLQPPPGQSRIISGEKAHRWVHLLRARVDGIIVGVHTVDADDPQLTARDVAVRRTAVRIVLDSRLRIEPGCRLVRTARQVSTLVLTTHAAIREHSSRVGGLRKCGVEVVGCRTRRDRVDLHDAMRKLGERGMTNVMVEGGAAVLNEFLRLGLADEVCVFVAPKTLGGGAPVVEIPQTLADGARMTARRVGGDMLFRVVTHEG